MTFVFVILVTFVYVLCSLLSVYNFSSFVFTKTLFETNSFERGTLQEYSFKKDLSRLMGKPTICIGENKDADQLRGNHEADQRLCFRYLDSIIPLLLKAEISSF